MNRSLWKSENQTDISFKPRAPRPKYGLLIKQLNRHSFCVLPFGVFRLQTILDAEI